MNEKLRLMIVAFVCCLGLLTSCGPAPECTDGQTQACKCGTLSGTQTCTATGSFSACFCQSKVITNRPPEPNPIVDGGPGPDKPTVKPDGGTVTPPTETPVTPDATTPEPPPNVTCPGGQFAWQGQCYSIDAFCTSSTGDNTMPLFTKQEQTAMQRPFVVEFDQDTGKPLFCQTRVGFYYLKGFGYGICDNDGDGWINIFANQAVTSTDTVIQRNARCQVLKIEAVVYTQDAQKWPEVNAQTTFVQRLTTPVSLVETDKNDGLDQVTKLPVYTKDQQPLPKTPGTACSRDDDCQGTGLCYIGHCVVGRRFRPEEVNTFTKACIAGIDLNDNQLDDANEDPSSQPNPSTEFTPLLKLAYFVELHFGYYQPGYQAKDGSVLRVWRVNERVRKGTQPTPGALALKCPEHPDAFQPDYWRSCGLLDDQQCNDPNQPGQKKKGLSKCWLPDVKRATPSLFKCVVFDSANNPVTQAGFFHPTNYGRDKHYTRTACNMTGTWTNPDPTNPHKQDFSFSCTADDGKNAPSLSKKQVGWACVAFQKKDTKADYLSGCIDEMAFRVCGPSGGDNNLVYLQHEVDSYGLVRAKRECGPKAGLGVCKSAEQTCTGGRWTFCGLCNTCPQATKGQRALCPGAVWGAATPPGKSPINSCKPIVKPSVEKCDGLDNDCDGSVDEGLPTLRFYPDADGDTYGDAKASGGLYCAGQQPKGWVSNQTDCDDTRKTVHPKGKEVCDGIDNNCDGQRDNNIEKWYNDDDKDGFGRKGQPAFEGCQRQDGKVCTGPGQCRDTAGFVKDGRDCCDSDRHTFPGQTAYTTVANSCGSFDRNCDGVESPQQKVCQCSKTSEWFFNTYPTTRLGGFLKYSHNPTVRTPVRVEPVRFSNPTSCELSGAMTFQVQNDINRGYTYDVVFGGSCTANGGGVCSFAPQRLGYKLTGGSWTDMPKDITGKPLIMWQGAGSTTWTAGCIFHKDGRRPKCGDVGASVAPYTSKTDLKKTVNLPGAISSPITECQQHTACSGITLQVDIQGLITSEKGWAVFTDQPTFTAPTIACR